MVVEERAPLDGMRVGSTGASIDLGRIRQTFVLLMDAAASRVTRLGYDLDDCICERFVELQLVGATQEGLAACHALATEETFVQSIKPADAGPNDEFDLTGLVVRTTIEDSKPLAPPAMRGVM